MLIIKKIIIMMIVDKKVKITIEVQYFLWELKELIF